jgi:nucleoside 2-deoxyribosyltransferase
MSEHGINPIRVYLAAPLFNPTERQANIDLRDFLVGLGLSVYLPQEDAGVSYDLLKRHPSMDRHLVRKDIFAKDISAIRSSDILVCCLDGRVPDEGTCVELGYAYALGKQCIGYKRDDRALDRNGDNSIMVDGCILWNIAASLDELAAAIRLAQAQIVK